jgi:hypothetical protein
LVVVFLKQHTVHLNKPIAIGFTILERAKEIMYNDFYNVITPKLIDSEVWVLMSDTGKKKEIV